MMNEREVVLFLETVEEVEIQVVDLQSGHVSRSFLAQKVFEQKLKEEVQWTLQIAYLFPPSQLVSVLEKEINNNIIRTYQNRQPADEFGVKVTKIKTRFPWKAVNMHMLLQLNEDFDGDFLHDAIQMLCDIIDDH